MSPWRSRLGRLVRLSVPPRATESSFEPFKHRSRKYKDPSLITVVPADAQTPDVSILAVHTYYEGWAWFPQISVVVNHIFYINLFNEYYKDSSGGLTKPGGSRVSTKQCRYIPYHHAMGVLYLTTDLSRNTHTKHFLIITH